MLAAPSIALVPIDDRPVTLQLPKMLGAVAGIEVRTPPRGYLGRYLVPGDTEAIGRWLRSDATRDADALVVSTDMLVYGGLVASRVRGVSIGDGISRLRVLEDVRRLRPAMSIYGFGTVMRLAPTGIPALGSAAGFFAAGEAWPLIQQYANLPDPAVAPEDIAKAQRIRERLGPTLDAYLQTRRRNLDVDLYALQLCAEGTFDRLVLGQDDAGAVGLHLRDLAVLRAAQRRFLIADRSAIEPGADELGMTLAAAAFAKRVRWTPSVQVIYSRTSSGANADPLEFTPIDATIGALIAASGSRRVAQDGQIDLFVRTIGTSAADELTFVERIASSVERGSLVAVADLTFLGKDEAEQRTLVETLIERRLAGSLAGFASWNTTANTIGTALPMAIAVGAGKRSGTFSQVALAQLLLDRYADDYAFHSFVRPALIADLVARDIDRTYLTPEIARATSSANRSALWPYTLALLSKVFPQYRDAGLTITLPWDRTFEAAIDVRLR